MKRKLAVNQKRKFKWEWITTHIQIASTGEKCPLSYEIGRAKCTGWTRRRCSKKRSQGAPRKNAHCAIDANRNYPSVLHWITEWVVQRLIMNTTLSLKRLYMIDKTRTITKTHLPHVEYQTMTSSTRMKIGTITQQNDYTLILSSIT